jgi:hypothetical protein
MSSSLFRKGPRVPLEYLINHDPNVIPIPEPISDLLPQLLKDFTSWADTTSALPANKAATLQAIDMFRATIEPCRWFKDSFVLLLHGPLGEGLSGRRLAAYLADFKFSIYLGNFDDGLYQLQCVFTNEEDDDSRAALGLLPTFRITPGTIGSAFSPSIYSLTPAGHHYFGINPTEFLPPPGPPSLPPTPPLPSPAASGLDSALVSAILKDVLQTVASSNQVTQDNLVSQLARVSSHVPDGKAAALAQADEIKGIFFPPDTFTTRCTNPDGRVNLVSMTHYFKATVARLCDLDKPAFSDECALRCALLRFHDQGPSDASLNDFRPRGSPVIATTDAFLAASHFLVHILSQFFGSHLIAPLEHLTLGLVSAHRRYGLSYDRLVHLFDRKLGSLRSSSSRVLDARTHVLDGLLLNEDDEAILLELSRQQVQARLLAVQRDVAADAPGRRSQRLAAKAAKAAGEPKPPSAPKDKDRQPRAALPTLLGTSATDAPCHNWIRGLCTSEPCPQGRPHSFDDACPAALVKSYKQAVLGPPRSRP